MVIPQRSLQSDVGLAGTFPCHIRIANSTFRHCSITCTIAIYITQIVGTVCHIGCRHIEETLTSDLVVTYLTIRASYLQEVHEISLWEERLFRNSPSSREGREESETTTLCKVLRTVVTHIKLKHVTMLVVIGQTSHDALICIRHIIFQSWLMTLSLIVEQQCGKLMIFPNCKVIVYAHLYICATIATVTARRREDIFRSCRLENEFTSIIASNGVFHEWILGKLLYMLVVVLIRHCTFHCQSLNSWNFIIESYRTCQVITVVFAITVLIESLQRIVFSGWQCHNLTIHDTWC